jgi:hypothetical protein
MSYRLGTEKQRRKEMWLLPVLSVAAVLSGCVVHSCSGPPPQRTVIIEKDAGGDPR